MPDARKGSYKRPLVVDADFFSRLAHLIDEHREVVCKEIADEAGMPATKVRRIANGQLLPKERSSLAVSPDNFDKAMAALRENDEIQRVQIRLESALGARIRVTYPSGISTSGHALADAVDSLRRENEAPEVFTVHAGAGPSHLNFFVMTRSIDSFTTAIYEVTGDRRDVDHFSNEISSLLKCSEPDHAWLHFRLTSSLVGIVSFGLLFFCLSRLMSMTGIPNKWDWPGMIWLLVPVLAMLLQFRIDRTFDRAFPKVQYEFGPQWRHTQARRKIISLVLTAVLIPSLLTIAFSLFQ